MARVVVAMSGGVDSSVAAALLCEEGHEVIGLFMRHRHMAPAAEPCAASPNESGPVLPILSPRAAKHGCCSAADALDARRVADRLGIAFYAIDFQDEFDRLIDYFVDEYAAGRTPNPCVMCNNWLKFGRLCDYADSVGADCVATGHYARWIAADQPDGKPALHAALDPGKDQSYVLFGISPAVLPRVRFPVGSFTKAEIRSRAAALGLRVADKPDSQEICFVPEGDYRALVRQRRPAALRPGEIVTTDGAVVGRHSGLEQFTIGQRKGLGVALGEPRYVVRLEPESGRVVIGQRQELARRRLTAAATNWLVDPPTGAFACDVKIRYNARRVAARAEVLAGSRLAVAFDQPQWGVAPGQAVVCYRGQRVLGGGWIE